MSKYIDAEKLRTEIKRLTYQKKEQLKRFNDEDYSCSVASSINCELNGNEEVLSLIDSLQQEQPIKVYRVENEKESKGLWRKFDGTWEPLFDMLTDGQCKDMPMEDSPIYREGGKRWFASAPSKETLQKWFSRRDLEELTAAGFTITEFEVLEYRKLSDFEYIFTRESIVNKTNINVTDIYPKERPEVDLEKFTEKMNTWKARYNYPDNIPIKAAMAFTARMFYQYPNVARQWYEQLPKATMDNARKEE